MVVITGAMLLLQRHHQLVWVLDWCGLLILLRWRNALVIVARSVLLLLSNLCRRNALVIVTRAVLLLLSDLWGRNALIVVARSMLLLLRSIMLLKLLLLMLLLLMLLMHLLLLILVRILRVHRSNLLSFRLRNSISLLLDCPRVMRLLGRNMRLLWLMCLGIPGIVRLLLWLLWLLLDSPRIMRLLTVTLVDILLLMTAPAATRLLLLLLFALVLIVDVRGFFLRSRVM